jgi:hypothetical protein
VDKWGGSWPTPYIQRLCMECRLKEKRCLEQRIGLLLDHRVGPCPVFQSVVVDLFGREENQGTINKRQTGKGCGGILLCAALSAIHVKFVDTNSTDSFLMALRRIMCVKEAASRIQSDRGDQLSCLQADRTMKLQRD